MEIMAWLISPIAIAVIILSCIVIVVSFFGCCGSALRVRWMLAAYLALIVVLALVAIAASIAAFNGFSQVDSFIDNAWSEKTDTQTKSWIYQHFNCCGFTQPDNSTVCQDAKKKNPDIQGCRPKLKAWMIDHIAMFAGCMVGVCAILVVGMTLTCCLISNLPKKNGDYQRLINDDEVGHFSIYGDGPQGFNYNRVA